MKLLGITLVVLALSAAGCGGGGRARPLQTADHVASLIRAKWGTTKGMPSFDYTCRRLDDRGRLFTCFARDHSDTVRIASFDVVCDVAKCTWTDYPSYSG
jgi:hypothetical protein